MPTSRAAAVLGYLAGFALLFLIWHLAAIFVVKSVLPTLGIMLVCLAIITWWPGLALGLVRC